MMIEAHKPQRSVLLIDDDRTMAEMLAEFLAPEGYLLQLAFTATEGLKLAVNGGLVLIVLDVMLPGMSGFEVLRLIRASSHVPVIMLTTRSEVTDRIHGLDLGADDYVPKPFTPAELLARIRTVLRRGQPSRYGPPFIIMDDLVLDSGSRTVECHGEPVTLTGAEFDILHCLVSSVGTPMTRETLTRLALGRSPYAGDRAIDNLVYSLRKKLGPGKNRQERFRSVRNAGYVYLCHKSDDHNQ
jgi:two-component system response regulator CpxR